jgi:starvation-inducible DNA-binding protein
MFASLHQMFGDLVTDLDAIADEIAERVVQLGGIAEATTRSIQRRASLNPAAAGMDGDTHVAILATAVAAAAAACRHAIDGLSHHRDPVTIDVLTDAARRLEKWLWYLEAHCVDHS